MLIIAGHSLKEEQCIFSAIQNIYGIGFNKANQILHIFGWSRTRCFKDLKYPYQIKLNKAITHYVHGFRAKRELKERIDNLFDNRCYRGVRHSYFLSVRGQRTRTNAKTQKNKKKKKIK